MPLAHWAWSKHQVLSGRVGCLVEPQEGLNKHYQSRPKTAPSAPGWRKMASCRAQDGLSKGGPRWPKKDQDYPSRAPGNPPDGQDGPETVSEGAYKGLVAASAQGPLHREAQAERFVGTVSGLAAGSWI